MSPSDKSVGIPHLPSAPPAPRDGAHGCTRAWGFSRQGSLPDRTRAWGLPAGAEARPHESVGIPRQMAEERGDSLHTAAARTAAATAAAATATVSIGRVNWADSFNAHFTRPMLNSLVQCSVHSCNAHFTRSMLTSLVQCSLHSFNAHFIREMLNSVVQCSLHSFNAQFTRSMLTSLVQCSLHSFNVHFARPMLTSLV